jgi:hypothetical protein
LMGIVAQATQQAGGRVVIVSRYPQNFHVDAVLLEQGVDKRRNY